MKFYFFLLLTILAIIGLIIGADTLYTTSVAKQMEEVPAISSAVKIKTIKKLIDKKPASLINGFDWSLPDSTKANSHYGMLSDSESSTDTVPHKFLIVLWNQTNPRKGVYNFSKLEKQLNNLQGKALVRLEVNSSCEAPVWALKKLRSSKDKSLIFWDENYISFLRDYVKAFAIRFASSSKIMGVQLGIGDGEFNGPCKNHDNKDGWGEFWMSPAVLAEAQQQFGLTPAIFEESSKKIIDLYVKAFGKYRNKLAYTNFGPLFSWDDIATPYNLRLAKLADYALERGVGNRDGGTEPWMRFLSKIYGVKISSMPDNTCRIDFDEGYADKIQERYWGSENEFYGNLNYVIEKHGPYKNQPYRFMISSLRALQMRRNYITVSNMSKMKHSDYKTQDFMIYLSKVLGKQIENTPDAFVVLGERYISTEHAEVNGLNGTACVKNSGNSIPFRSFGRWLTDTGNSVPAVKVKMPKEENYWDQDYYLPTDKDYEYSARKAKSLSFDINDQLAIKRCKLGCEVAVKVTFKDTVKSKLKVLVEEGYTQTLQTLGDSKIKTATFYLKSIFNNGVSGSDFIVQSDGEPVPVMLLRVNFL